MKFRNKETGEVKECGPVMINAALVSAQNRKRLFWVGSKKGSEYARMSIALPKDQGILLKDILEHNVDQRYYVNVAEKYKQKGLVKEEGKAKSLSATCWKGYGNDGVSLIEDRENDGLKFVGGIGDVDRFGDGKNLSRNFPERNRVYSEEGKAATLAAGGLTGVYLVNDETEEQPVLVRNQGADIIKPLDKAVTLRSRDYKGFDNYNSNAVVQIATEEEIEDAKGVASRTWPRTKTEGEERIKQLEVRSDEKANSLTTIQTDSMVQLYVRPHGYIDEQLIDDVDKYPTLCAQGPDTKHLLVISEEEKKKAIVVDNVYPSGGQNGNVYSVEGKAPTLSADSGISGNGIGSCNAPKIEVKDNTEGETKITPSGYETNDSVPEIGQANRVYGENGKICPLNNWAPKVGVSALVNSQGKTHQQELLQDAEGKCRTIPAGTHGSTPHLLKTIVPGGYIRKLTPVECERLQSLTDYNLEVIFKICSDQQKSCVNVVNKNLKSQKLVGSVENNNSQEIVKFVENPLNTKNLSISEPVPINVLINCGENNIVLHLPKKSELFVSSAEKKNLSFQEEQVENIVRSLVFIKTIGEKIIIGGGGELPQKNKNLAVQMSGKNVVEIYGKGITQLVEDAEKNSTTLKRLLKYTTLDPSNIKDKEQTIQILFSYVVSAIVGYIPKEILNQNTLTLKVIVSTGYTYGVSNTQRYKCLGNAFNASVVAHIMTFLKEALTEGEKV